MKSGNKTRKIFILIVSLLFIFQLFTIMGQAAANTNTPSTLNDLINLINDETNDNDHETNADDPETNTDTNNDNDGNTNDNDGNTNVPDTNEENTNEENNEPTNADSDRYENYLATISDISNSNTEPSLDIECSYDDRTLEVTVTSNDNPASDPIEVTVLGNTVTTNTGAASFEIPEAISEYTNSVTVRVNDGTNTYTKYASLEEDNPPPIRYNSRLQNLIRILRNIRNVLESNNI